jgi:tight adherence protein B
MTAVIMAVTASMGVAHRAAAATAAGAATAAAAAAAAGAPGAIVAAVATALVVLLAGAGLRVHRSRPRTLAPATSRRRRSSPPDPHVLADHLGAVAREVRAGAHLAAARRSVPTPVWLVEPRWADHPHVALVRQMLDATGDLGGPIAPALDAAATVLRDRAAVAADTLVHSAQARLSARILTVVPLGFAAWGVATSPRTRDAVLHSTLGAACAVAGIALNLAGWRWMRACLRRVG